MPYASPVDSPKAGDVILKRTTDASRRYTLCTFGEVPQIACQTLEDAVARADRFARFQHVDVWKTDDGRAFTRIIECRFVSSV